MSVRRIAYVDCLEGALADYCFESVAGYFTPEFEPLRILAMSGAVPTDAGRWSVENGIAGMVIGGSCYSPLDDEPWIRRIEPFVAGCVGAGFPILAICFGHELLASALDGKLGRLPEQAITMRDVEILVDDPLFAGFGPAMRQPVSHSVYVESPPSGFDVIASTAECRVMAMKQHGRPVYGVQFHPEVDAGIKGPDPTWGPVSDEEFAETEGPAVMRNFAQIVQRSAG